MNPPDSPALNIMTTVAMKGVLDELEDGFARTHGRRFAMTFGPGGVTARNVRAGTPFDVVISSPPTLGELAAEGFIDASTQQNIAQSIVGVAVRAGAPKPKIATLDEFKQTLLDAKSVAYTDPSTGAASGVHFVKVMEKLGVTDIVNAKAKLGDGGPVAQFVARGEAELAIQQLCEHMLVKGVDVVGPVPKEIQSVTTLAAAVHAKASHKAAAQALVAMLVSPLGQTCLPRHGLLAVV